MDRFARLKRADVEKWAGRVIFKRGDAYHREGRAKNPAMTADGALIAWVYGTDKYATLVEMDGGDLDSNCTCPYDDLPPCKHAVALLLAYLEAKEKKRRIPTVKSSDARLVAIDDVLALRDLEDDDEYDERAPAPRRSAARRKEPQSDESAISRFLSGQSREGLIQLIGEWVGRVPEITDELAHRGRLAAGDTRSLASAIRRDIVEITSQEAWYDHWRHEGNVPDYSGLKLKLIDLLDTGAADDVVRLGELLLLKGKRQVETSHDEGDAAAGIASCMEVVFRALSRATMPAEERMMWAIDADLKDSFGLCEGCEAFWEKGCYSATDWSGVADKLLKRLSSLKSPANKGGGIPKSQIFRHEGSDDGISFMTGGSFADDYQRDRLTNWITRALENAGRNSEIIPLCESEAERTGSYVRLVKHLIECGRSEDAERWCRRGFEATLEQKPGIAHALRTSLREMHEKKGDWLSAAAFRAEEFIERPSLDAFKALEKAAKRAKVLPPVRNAVFHYLETGRLPAQDAAWPLPETGTVDKKLRPRRSNLFPMVSTLIDIAVAENKPDEALRWYDLQKARQSYGHIYDEDRLARAVKQHYPERAAALWKGLAERQIALANPAAYRQAVGYLEKMREVLIEKDEGERFYLYLSNLRETHLRKKRLIELLDKICEYKRDRALLI